MERETGQEKAPAANRGDGGFFQEAAHTQATGADRLGHERGMAQSVRKDEKHATQESRK